MTSPFSNKAREWGWPTELDVEFDEDTAVIKSVYPGSHSPDIRGLTILDGSDLCVTRKAGVAALRLDLGSGWVGTPALFKLERRVGLLRHRGLPIDMRVDGMPRSTLDPLHCSADGLSFEPDDQATAVKGTGLELVSRGLDEWIDEADGRLRRFRADEAEEQAPPTLPVVRLVFAEGGVHPRAPRICARLVSCGVPLLCADKVARRTFRDTLIEAGRNYKLDVLGIAECGTWHGVEYDHILPVNRAHESVWCVLLPDLERDLPGPFRHSAFGSLNSSQSFAFNVIGGLRAVGLLAPALERALSLAPGDLLNPEVRFEFGPPELREALGEGSDHYTQIDSVIWWTDSRDSRQALLVEVKLTEAEFGACRGPDEAGVAAKAVCVEADDATRRELCYLRTPPNARRYLDRQAAFEALARNLGIGRRCPLNGPGYQLARNLIARQWLEQDAPPEYRVARARFAVLSASETPALASPALRGLGATPGERLRELGVEWINARSLIDGVAASPESRPLCAYLRQRYSPVFMVPGPT